MNDSQLQQQAAALLNQERYSESIALYEQCIEANPSKLSNYWHLGVALLLQGDEALAQAVWLTVFTQGDETEVEVWSRELLQILHAYGFKYFQERKLPLAETIYQQILDFDSTQLEAYLGLGRLFLSHGEFDRAIESLQQALALQPNLSEAHYNIGLCFKNKHQLDRAIEHLKQCVEIDNSLAKAYLNLGLCYYEKYAIARAIDYFDKARKLDGSFPETYLNLGVCYKTQEAYSEAIRYFQKAIELSPNFTAAYFHLGGCYWKTGQIDQAIAQVKKAIELQPNLAEAHYSLGLFLLEAGKFDEAIAQFQYCQRLNPNLIDAKRQLDELRNCEEAGYFPQLRQTYQCWDAILFNDDDCYRLFYLTSSRKAHPFWSQGEMGAAISTDLKRWQYRGIVLAPLPEHHWESGRIMAGSLYKENDTYFFFYSAAPAEAILQEAIGLATSSDGLHWQRRSEPFLTLDTRFYSSGYFFKDVTIKHQQWRDPYIFKDPRTDKYYLFFTTSSRLLKPPFNGCVGVAVSDRIDGTYEILPPVVLPRIAETEEGIFNEMERPQVIYQHDKYHLFFSASPSHMNPRWIEKVGREELTFSSLYWFVCDRITGPYEPMGEKPVVKGSDRTNLYGTSLIQGKEGNFFAVGSYYKSQTLEVSARISVLWEEDILEIRRNSP